LTPPANAFGQTGAGRFGEVSQLDRGFVDQDTTLVTLSIGGNDARFSDVIEECLVYAGLKACQDATLPGSSVPAGQEVPDLIQGKVEDSIVTVLREIRRKAPNAKIMLMGYPRLLENRGNCIEVIDEPEADWLNSMSDLMAKHMNEAVTRANAEAGKVFTWFSDPRDEYTGRAVCGSPEEVHGLVSYFNKTPGEPPEKAFSQQSFHPKSPGQDTYALSMNETLRRMGL
jgi:lysophospholipase L1-like esterase